MTSTRILRGTGSIRAVYVVVPARDEEARLPDCLAALRSAVAALQVERPGITVRTLVVLDRCRDGSQRVAARFAVPVLPVDAGAVGAARRAGVVAVSSGDLGVGCGAGIGGDQVWLANTDADTVVGRDWLVDQVRLAELGNDLVLGRVRPDPTELSPVEVAAWAARHDPRGTSIHGANLGVRLSTYLAAGGFPAVREHEDVVLVEAVRRAGHPWTIGPTVTTSARRTGRTPGGFAGYLRTLRLEIGATPG
ncbi:glycosyltransferase [Nocardioides sambongensis]|uniref:glycosyltransferase n=1 Tax=Nocardioides sambongensis TaxID=2589074 RepID=UPI0015E851C8|nr:glycosyltransferase [Nocardioides sambongensis]